MWRCKGQRCRSGLLAFWLNVTDNHLMWISTGPLFCLPSSPGRARQRSAHGCLVYLCTWKKAFVICSWGSCRCTAACHLASNWNCVLVASQRWDGLWNLHNMTRNVRLLRWLRLCVCVQLLTFDCKGDFRKRRRPQLSVCFISVCVDRLHTG